MASRPAVVAIGSVVAVGLVATAIVQRDVAGVFAVLGLVFLGALAGDAFGLRGRIPGLGPAGLVGTLATVALYTLVIGLAYGVVAQVAPAPEPLGGGGGAAKEPKAAGSSDPQARRPSLSVISPEEPVFLATVIRVLAPTTVVLDGDETVDLAGVPELSSTHPAYEPARRALADLVLGRVVTVEAGGPEPDGTGLRRLAVTLTVPTGRGRPVVVNDAILRLIESARRQTP
ncbi:MAG: hypothetical protein ACYC41_01505 [Bacillota bacterium]